MSEQKINKQILLEALGRKEDSPEVQKLFRILGEPDEFEDSDIETTIYNGKRYSYVDAESGDFGFAWRKYGIDLTFINQDYVGLTPKSYPLGKDPELETIILDIKPDTQEGYDSCLGICEDPFFHEGMHIDEIVAQFGEPQKIWSSEKMNITRYTYFSPKGFEKTRIKFSFPTDTKEIFKISIVLEEK